MGKRGPKPRTVENSRPIQAVDSSWDWVCPDHLTGLAREEYGRIVDLVRQHGNLSKTDPRLIEIYAINYELLRRAYAEVEAQGPTVESDRGNVSEHPSIQTINSCTIRLKAIINDLGLTPSSCRYSSVQADIEEETNEWSERLKVG